VTETKFDQINRHVREARGVVSRQIRLIATQKASGRDTAASEQLLAQFERTLAIFEAELVEVQSDRP
jgi:hypothetical protein